MPDSAFQLAGFQLFGADRDMELSGRARGGGVCFYSNSGWCRDEAVALQRSSPDLESLIVHCRLFYSLFGSLPSGWRLTSIRTKTSHHTTSFFPSAVRLMNTLTLMNRARVPH